MSTFKNSDRCTDMILDFIAGGVPSNPSGEANGNYNAIFGHPGSADELSIRTISGIFALQKAMLARDRRSSAVGRYQFLRSTLRTLQSDLDLSSSDLFTHELQDRLAVRLLVQQGYSAWWRDELVDSEFAHRISTVWASLPDPDNGGRSHYDGDSAGNHASTTLAAVYAMLHQARAAKPTPA